MIGGAVRSASVDKRPGHNNNGLIALLMALDRAEHKPAPVKILGWL